MVILMLFNFSLVTILQMESTLDASMEAISKKNTMNLFSRQQYHIVSRHAKLKDTIMQAYTVALNASAGVLNSVMMDCSRMIRAECHAPVI